eukprot:839451-Pelagomonas_calceolata.AAC.1
MLGSPRGCAQVARGRSGCDAMSLPASACTPVPASTTPTSTLPQWPPSNSNIIDWRQHAPKLLRLQAKAQSGLFLTQYVCAVMSHFSPNCATEGSSPIHITDLKVTNLGSTTE